MVFEKQSYRDPSVGLLDFGGGVEVNVVNRFIAYCTCWNTFGRCCFPSVNSGDRLMYCVPSPMPNPQPRPTPTPQPPPMPNPASPMGAPPNPYPAPKFFQSAFSNTLIERQKSVQIAK